MSQTEYRATGGTVFTYDPTWKADTVMIRQLDTALDAMDVPAIDLIEFLAECFAKPTVIRRIQKAEPEDIVLAAWRLQ